MLALLLLLPLAAATQAIASDCPGLYHQLEGRLAHISPQFKHAEVIERFVNSPTMLYHNPRQELFPGKLDFHASNEFDWFRTPWDDRKASVVVGFSSNSAWDIAVRKDADHLVITDWHIGPLLTQEYLLKPLILESHSPQDFLGLLTGVPLPANLEQRPVSETFAYIDHYLSTHVRPFHGPVYDDERKAQFQRILERLERNPLVTDDQLTGVKSYFDELQRLSPRQVPATLGPLTGRYLGKVQEHLSAGRGPIFENFRQRYDSLRLVAQGADEHAVNAPFFSAFSSPEAFGRLKRLFSEGKVTYAHASYDDPALYARAAALARPAEARSASPSLTISISNIVDCHADSVCDQEEKIRHLIELARGSSKKAESMPITLYGTHGTDKPHQYYRQEFAPRAPSGSID